MIIFYYNDIYKHDKTQHIKYNDTAKALNVNNSTLKLDESDNIIIDNDDSKYDKNIYIITYHCQTEILKSTNVISELRKSFKNVSYFILNMNNYWIPPDVFHKDDIIIYCNPWSNSFPNGIHPAITLKELSEKLVENEDFYICVNNCNHVFNTFAILYVSEYLRKVIENIPKPESPEPHKIIHNLNAKYAMEKWIKDTHLELFKDMFDNVLIEGRPNGFIEMNCNPMTVGHVHLIKTALKYLSKNSPNGKLIIAVVKKDSESSNICNNMLRFEIRYNIIKKVCSKISDKIVVVSNENIFAGDVFNGYQKADKNTQDRYQGGTNAMKLFGHFGAPMAGIGYRFFGTEPTDITTSKYNEDAKRILPKLGCKVIIVNRI